VRSYVGNDMVARLEVGSMLGDRAILSKRIGEDEVEDVGRR
jgi:hypothetical protein